MFLFIIVIFFTHSTPPNYFPRTLDCATRYEASEKFENVLRVVYTHTHTRTQKMRVTLEKKLFPRSVYVILEYIINCYKPGVCAISYHGPSGVVSAVLMSLAFIIVPSEYLRFPLVVPEISEGYLYCFGRTFVCSKRIEFKLYDKKKIIRTHRPIFLD